MSAMAVLFAFLIHPPNLALAQSPEQDSEPARPYAITEQREPCAIYDPLRRPFFGDTHVHTAYSFDARTQDTRTTPRDAYRFATGEVMGLQPYDSAGNPLRTIQLDRPLDFTAVTDHSEFLGEVNICTTPGTWSYWHPVCYALRHFPNMAMITIAGRGLAGKSRWGFCGKDDEACFTAARGVWGQIQDAAEEAYDRSARCSFTSFVGYEWTASVGAGQNLHRNVIFRNEKVPAMPLSWIETPSAVDLWDFLEQKCLADIPGCNALTIPHNSNLSGGLMFETARVSSTEVPAGAVTAEEARRRARWEPLFEVVQHKGSSECDRRSSVWATDEFCDFEKLPYDSFGGKNTGSFKSGPITWASWFFDDSMKQVTKLPEPNNFMRWALKEGLRQQQELGVNSFKFGIIGSTDTHIAAAGRTEEKGHPGHGGAGMGAGEGVPKGFPDELEFGPGGLAVLWAEENNRDSLFAAMQRREAYATSGTRPILRFFGGWDYPDDLCDDSEMVAKGYAGGVPMGGDLRARPVEDSTQGPRFVVAALKDSGSKESPGTALQRIQIIKGWYEDGEVHEKVLDVAGGDNGASVDLATCEQRGEGHASLCTVWQDTTFDPDVSAFYYARVLENPSCRWSQYVCIQAQVNCDDPASIPEGLENCCSSEHKPVIQERAWSSPIWYTPESNAD